MRRSLKLLGCLVSCFYISKVVVFLHMQTNKGFATILAVIVGLLIVGGGAYLYLQPKDGGVAVLDKENQSVENDYWIEYINQNTGITFKYPSDWSIYEREGIVTISDADSVELDEDRTTPNYSVSFALIDKTKINHTSGYGHVVYDAESDLIKKDEVCLDISKSTNEKPEWIMLGGSTMSTPAWTSSAILLDNSEAIKYTKFVYGSFAKEKEDIVSEILSSVKVVGEHNVSSKVCPENGSQNDVVVDAQDLIRKPFTINDITFNLVQSGEKHLRNSDLYFTKDGVEKLIYKNIKYGPNGGYFFSKLEDSNLIKLEAGGGDICAFFGTDLYIDLDNPEYVVFIKHSNACSVVDNLAFGVNNITHFDIELIEDNECTESNSEDKLNIAGLRAVADDGSFSEFEFDEPVEITCTGIGGEGGYRDKSISYTNVNFEEDKIFWDLKVYSFVDAAAEPYSKTIPVKASPTSGFDM